MAVVTSKEIKNQKEMITMILKTKGEKYNNWLYDIHQEFIDANQVVVMQALAAFATGGVTEVKPIDTKDEQDEEQEEEKKEVQNSNTFKKTY